MRKFGILAALAVALILPASLEAAPILLTPDTPGVIPGADDLGNSDCEPGCVEEVFGVEGLTLLYKGNEGGLDEGTFADSYDTVFDNEPNDPMDATISWIVGTPSITCPNCYLAIKDGNATPSYYFYNLADWDGISAIIMTNFWPNQGAISHVSIWGSPADDDGGQDDDGSTIPEPASVLLLGLGMAAAAARMRQRKA